MSEVLLRNSLLVFFKIGSLNKCGRFFFLNLKKIVTRFEWLLNKTNKRDLFILSARCFNHREFVIIGLKVLHWCRKKKKMRSRSYWILKLRFLVSFFFVLHFFHLLIQFFSIFLGNKYIYFYSISLLLPILFLDLNTWFLTKFTPFFFCKHYIYINIILQIIFGDIMFLSNLAGTLRFFESQIYKLSSNSLIFFAKTIIVR